MNERRNDRGDDNDEQKQTESRSKALPRRIQHTSLKTKHPKPSSAGKAARHFGRMRLVDHNVLQHAHEEPTVQLQPSVNRRHYNRRGSCCPDMLLASLVGPSNAFNQPIEGIVGCDLIERVECSGFISYTQDGFASSGAAADDCKTAPKEGKEKSLKNSNRELRPSTLK